MDSSKLLKNVYGIDIHFEDLVYQVNVPKKPGKCKKKKKKKKYVLKSEVRRVIHIRASFIWIISFLAVHSISSKCELTISISTESVPEEKIPEHRCYSLII